MKLLFDTNVIIDFLKQKTGAIDLSPLFLRHECFVSVIIKLELLKYPEITPDEERAIVEFLRLVPVMPLNEAIEIEAIALAASRN